MEFVVMILALAFAVLAFVIFFIIANMDGRPMFLKYLPLFGAGLLFFGCSERSPWLGGLGLAITLGGYLAAAFWPTPQTNDA